MSVATEFPPDVYIPAAARRASLTLATVLPFPAAPAAAALGAEVVDLDRWRHHTYERSAADLSNGTVAAAPVRLTHRGLVVLGGLSVVVAVLVVALAWLCAPASSSGAGSAAPATVTVKSGDSLWSMSAGILEFGLTATKPLPN